MYRVFEALDELVTICEEARGVPMTSSCVVPRGDVLELLDDIREALPGEVDDAQDVLDQRDEIIARRDRPGRRDGPRPATAEAERMMAEARAQAERIIAEARAEADRTIAAGEASTPTSPNAPPRRPTAWCRPAADAYERAVDDGASRRAWCPQTEVAAGRARRGGPHRRRGARGSRPAARRLRRLRRHQARGVLRPARHPLRTVDSGRNHLRAPVPATTRRARYDYQAQ